MKEIVIIILCVIWIAVGWRLLFTRDWISIQTDIRTGICPDEIGEK